ncbi:DNA polymerase IV [Halalkalibacter urbisdiaboli]|uniref:DNA polymerase IV n=1 Tax=Halalkalibacter urbisdiaboli TaxID=1960589 RepID=UPI000B439B17|nr:DNA polymerase IV [Halalkalibacter urbisdiaboli]
MAKGRVIFHIDMNSFYASVEMSYNPELKGKPIAIAGNVEERRGIIVTSSYEARANGVKTAMPIWQAKKLCPHLLILPPNFERYRAASRALFALLQSYTPLVQPVSIDEGYLDVTSYLKEVHPVTLALEIQRRVLEELNLSCSIGIAPNKFLAKMASDMQKPNGLTILRKRDVKSKLWPLPIGEMHGIGKRTVDKWKNYGYHTIGDLAKGNIATIEKRFGVNGVRLHERANGIDQSEVNPDAIYEFKSIGNSTTLREDTKNEKKILATFQQLAKSVSQRLRKKKVCANGVQITIKYHDWKTVTRSQKTLNPLQYDEDLFKVALELWKKSWNGEAIRLVGISTYDLIEQQHAYKQLDLFSYKEDEKNETLLKTIEDIHLRFGQNSLLKGYQIHEAHDDFTDRNKRGTSLERDFLDES